MTRVILALLIAIVIVIAVASTALALWQRNDRNAERALWTELASRQPTAPERFELSMLEGLPEPAQRYFRFAIKPGTLLQTVAEISMQGELGLGSKAEPNYLPMHAEQLLAFPQGFVWRLSADGVAPVSGSDAAGNGKSWSRFWAFGILPVARAGSNKDHLRSAFGRYLAEAVFWTPAALLKGDGVRWIEIDESTVRVTATYFGLEQSVDLSVDAGGRPTKVVFQRWSDANPAKVFQLQPFGGYLSEYREFGGFVLPTRVEAGNFFETEDYFPFFRVNVLSIRYPESAG